MPDLASDGRRYARLQSCTNPIDTRFPPVNRWLALLANALKVGFVLPHIDAPIVNLNIHRLLQSGMWPWTKHPHIRVLVNAVRFVRFGVTTTYTQVLRAGLQPVSLKKNPWTSQAPSYPPDHHSYSDQQK